MTLPNHLLLLLQQSPDLWQHFLLRRGIRRGARLGTPTPCDDGKVGLDGLPQSLVGDGLLGQEGLLVMIQVVTVVWGIESIESQILQECFGRGHHGRSGRGRRHGL